MDWKTDTGFKIQTVQVKTGQVATLFARFVIVAITFSLVIGVFNISNCVFDSLGS